jgi:hypothetical protein
MKTCICVIIKDEQDYLEEWIEYHLNLGIDEIFLYEDYGSKSHAEIIKPFGDRVHLESIDVVRDLINNCDKTGSYRQNALFNWFPIEYKDKFDWVLFNDIDEFLVLKQPLHELLEEYDDKPGILLEWKFYGANGHITKPKGKVMDNFTKMALNAYNMYGKNWINKSFVNLKNYTYWKYNIHGVYGCVYAINKNGCHKAWINHYFTKSWEEWKQRILVRGDTFIGNRKIYEFFSVNKDLENKKEELLSNILLDIAIDNATKLGFNKHVTKGNYNDKKYFHFCWFGHGEFSELNQKCIDSWKKFLSEDYVVCLWSENCFDSNSIKFTKNAYDFKKWAFVVDYVRLWCIYNFGGVYFDTDVELLKPIDNLSTNFFAIQKDYEPIALGLGFGAEKGNEIIKNMMEEYNDINYQNNTIYDIISTKLSSNYFMKLGYVVDDTKIHEFLGFTIYPSEYFCPKGNINNTMDITENTISIHHYTLSWY